MAIPAVGQTSRVVTKCQICGSNDLKSKLFLGSLPSVNIMHPIGAQVSEEVAYPAELLHCGMCGLAQLSVVVDARILFPSEYPYTSSTTKILRENFAELYTECRSLVKLAAQDLIIDIGSNDGNLLSNFKTGHRVLGITPEAIGNIAIERGIPTLISYFDRPAVDKVLKEQGKAKVVTATNVFAHIDDVGEVLKGITSLLEDDGVFISESHYLIPLVETLQYDTIYHEHLRYYSLESLRFLLEGHGLEIFHAKRIPTHGGSIRVYAARPGKYPVQASVAKVTADERELALGDKAFDDFRRRVVESKLELMGILRDVKRKGARVFGVSAPSRASTLINYVGIDDGILDCVVEVEGSHKIGKYVPGTRIPIVAEKALFEKQPEYALLLSWHIADELIPKLKAKGFKGRFIMPLPTPRVVD